MADSVSDFCVCGKRNYANRGAAVRERRAMRRSAGFQKRGRRPNQQSSREIEPYWCEAGGFWHLGHQTGKIRRLKRGLRG